MVELWGDIGFMLFTINSVIFTIIYLSMSRWYKSYVGSIIAIFCIGVDILCVYISLRIWGVHLPGVEWLRLVIFWVLGITMLGSVVGFLQVQFGRHGTKLRERMSKKYDDVKR